MTGAKLRARAWFSGSGDRVNLRLKFRNKDFWIEVKASNVGALMIGDQVKASRVLIYRAQDDWDNPLSKRGFVTMAPVPQPDGTVNYGFMLSMTRRQYEVEIKSDHLPDFFNSVSSGRGALAGVVLHQRK